MNCVAVLTHNNELSCFSSSFFSLRFSLFYIANLTISFVIFIVSSTCLMDNRWKLAPRYNLAHLRVLLYMFINVHCSEITSTTFCNAIIAVNWKSRFIPFGMEILRIEELSQSLSFNTIVQPVLSATVSCVFRHHSQKNLTWINE